MESSDAFSLDTSPTKLLAPSPVPPSHCSEQTVRNAVKKKKVAFPGGVHGQVAQSH